MFRMFGSVLDVLEQDACLGAIDNSTLLLKRSQTAVVDMCDAMRLADAVVCSAAVLPLSLPPQCLKTIWSLNPWKRMAPSGFVRMSATCSLVLVHSS